MRRKWVKLWRKSADSTIFAHDGMWKLFCLCLIKASHKEVEVTISGILKPIKLNPGQFITGRFALHEDYHQAHLKKKYRRKAAPTAYSLWRWLIIMEEMQILSIKSYNKYSIITVCNWPLYQGNDHQASIRRASSEHIQEGSKNELRNLSVDLYEFYVQEINSFQKTRQRALSNIAHHLKKNSTEDLKQGIVNYKTIALTREPQFRKDPANFFGKREPSFIDFLPDNFEPSNTSSQAPPKEITLDNAGELYEN